MIYYALDAYWDDTKEPQLGAFLSGANPFLFDDIGSADPAIYQDFGNKITGEVALDASYSVACGYIASLKNPVVAKAFHSIDQREWLECAKEYLAQEHKGKESDQ
jgi:hypothetical protein